MKKLLFLLLLLCTSCINYSDTIKCIQVNYTQNGEENSLFLNVRQISPEHFVVISQEYIQPTDFVITEFFNYDGCD